ncbi:hypothetical protein [Demequina pelophila]|uniref:hypothetical protein n=1 Tax=Demequina pelophila TaxID=1638984 RepID=UPI000782BD2B|nr:hypothetical protein [Demequina pelophila]
MKLRIPGAASTALLAAVALAGCSTINPITTQQAYDASDGVSVQIGDVRALNLIVVAEEEGGPAVLIGSLSNSGSEDVAVSASIDGDAIVTVDVAAGTTLTLGGESEETAVTGTATVQPGLLTTVVFQTDAEGQVERQVPVMDGTLPEYRDELERLG